MNAGINILYIFVYACTTGFITNTKNKKIILNSYRRIRGLKRKDKSSLNYKCLYLLPAVRGLATC